MAGAPDPKPRRRIVDELAIMAHKMQFSECQLCGAPAVIRRVSGDRYKTSLSFHHIVKKSQGGDDVAENGLVVCGTGTTGCHGDIEARRPDVLAAARAAMSEANEAYVIDKKSALWLEQHYPLRAPRHPRRWDLWRVPQRRNTGR